MACNAVHPAPTTVAAGGAFAHDPGAAMDIPSVMTANPATCTPDATLRQAAQLMKQNDCGQIPVVGQDRQPLGVITDRDIAVRAVAEGGDPASATVGDYMTSPVTTVPASCSLDDVARVMEQGQ